MNVHLGWLAPALSHFGRVARSMGSHVVLRAKTFRDSFRWTILNSAHAFSLLKNSMPLGHAICSRHSKSASVVNEAGSCYARDVRRLIDSADGAAPVNH